MAKSLSKAIKKEINDITRDLVSECVKKYQAKMSKLETQEDFVCDNWVRTREIKSQTMYKLRNKNGELYLEGRKGRKYEFLIEFDSDDFAYGIYFGCKCILNQKDKIARQVEECVEEWEQHIKRKLLDNLNRTFVNIDFTNRYIATDNVSDRTYWPFWIRLGENEDVIKVAALATKIIRNTYQWFFEDEKKDKNGKNDENGENGETNSSEGRQPGRPKSNNLVKTRYTESNYKDILIQLSNKKNYTDDAVDKFKLLIDVLVRKNVITPHLILERCWKLNWTITDFSLLFSMFYKKISKSPKKQNDKTVIEWKLITPIIISSKGLDVDNIKRQYSLKNVEDSENSDIMESFEVDQADFAQNLDDIIKEIFPE